MAARIPKNLEVQLAGESLFNDGIGVVVFLTLLRFAEQPGPDAAIDVAGATLLFLQETLGGILFGAVAFVLIKTVNDYAVHPLEA